MTQTNFNLNLALSLTESPDQFPIDFDDAWKWLAYNSKSDAKVSFKRCGFAKRIDFISFQESSSKPQGGRPLEKILLTVECFKTWGMMSGTQQGKEIRFYFLQCEKIAKDKMAQAITQEIDAVTKVNQFNLAIDGIFSNTQIEPSLISGLKLNTSKKYLPHLADELESARQLLIISTAKKAKLLTVTQIGQLLTPQLKAVDVNKLLITKGYQIKNPNKKGQKDLTYLPTDKAKDHCSITLATGANNSTTYQQLRWFDSIVGLL